MEAATPATSAGPKKAPAIIAAVIFALAAIFMAVVFFQVLGNEPCSEVASGECFKGSSGNRTMTLLASGLATLAALGTVVASIAYVRGKATGQRIGIAAGLTVLFILITIIL